MLARLFLFAGMILTATAFYRPLIQKTPLTIHYYDFLIPKKNGNKDEKKDMGRLLKNIMFPGIYREYEDTKEVKKTIVVSSENDIIRNNLKSYIPQLIIYRLMGGKLINNDTPRKKFKNSTAGLVNSTLQICQLFQKWVTWLVSLKPYHR